LEFADAIDIPSVQLWRDRFGDLTGSSDLHRAIDVFTYRINFGVKEKVVGGPRPYRRAVTIKPR
jgi:hypothetical protein